MKIQDDRKVFIIDWHDSRQPKPNWVFLDDLEDEGPVLCASVGWIISETSDTLTLCPNIGDIGGGKSTQGMGVMEIPTIAILNRTELTIPD